MKKFKKQPNVQKNSGCLFLLKEDFIMNEKIPSYINEVKRILNTKSIHLSTISYFPESSEPEREIKLPCYEFKGDNLYVITDFQHKVFDVFLPYQINRDKLLEWSKVLEVLYKNKSDKTEILKDSKDDN